MISFIMLSRENVRLASTLQHDICLHSASFYNFVFLYHLHAVRPRKNALSDLLISEWCLVRSNIIHYCNAYIIIICIYVYLFYYLLC